MSLFGWHFDEFWPGAHRGAEFVPGMPLCTLGAVAVARGARTVAEVQVVVDHDPAITVLANVVDPRDADSLEIAVRSDGPRWVRATPAGRWWLRRRAIATLHLAARSCRG